MQYKGEDLDLRVPHARSPRESYGSDYEAANGRWSRQRSAANGAEPLWVDEVLLACCNYAFDVAQANGAAEVDIEHLVNALTRVDAAARVLEARGVHEGQLRRESAALIASEIPAANAGDALVPRRSSDLEDVLRRATDLGQRRGYAAGIEDVLWVLLHSARDLPVVQLLRRLTPDWQRADWGRVREAAPQPEPPARPVQLVANDGVAARIAGLEDGFRLMQAELLSERKMLVDLVRDIQRDVVAQRGDGASFRGDLGQRLDTLERSVHLRGDGRVAAQLAERLGQIEKAVHGGLNETTRATAQLGQRLATLEIALSDGRVTGGQQVLADRMQSLESGLQQSFEDVKRATSQLGQRLQVIESGSGATRATAAQQAVAERMTALEKAVHGGLGEGARNWAHLGQRLTALEGSLVERSGSAQAETLANRMTALERDLDAMLNQRFGALEQLVGTARHGGLPDEVRVQIAGLERSVDERIRGLEKAWRETPVGLPEALGDLGDIGARLQRIEQRVEAATGRESPALVSMSERVGGLTRLVETAVGESNRTRLEIAERFQDVETQIAARLDAAQTQHPARLGDAAGVAPEVAARLAALEQAVRGGLGSTVESTGLLAERLGHVERQLTEHPRSDDEALLILDDRLGSIERQLEERGNDAASASHAIIERLHMLEKRPFDGGSLDANALIAPLSSRLEGIETSGSSNVEAVQVRLGEVMTRLGQLEERMRADAVVTEEALRGRDQDFDFIYNEIKQLGQSQATLNSAVSDWRTESQTHFGTLADRLERLHLRSLPPEPPRAAPPFEFPAVVTKPRNGADHDVMPANGEVDIAIKPGSSNGGASVTASGPGADSVQAEDYRLPGRPSRGFLYWLFGTENLAQANRETDLKVNRMRQNIRDAKERRRQI